MRKHFGVLCSSIDIANQHDIWKGIVEVASANDIHLTGFISTYQTTDNHFYSYLESCFDIMFGNDKLLDGVILSSGFIAQNVGLDEFNKYISKIPPGIPVVSISFEIPGIPSVITYNKGGMFSAVEHLICKHGKKHIAFVKGPDGHPEAEARLEGYKIALEKYGLPFDEAYLFPGDFGRDGGRNAVNELYDVRKIPVDAFACCNDQSAVGVLQYLKNRNLTVPGDVAVIGFDNDIISSIYVPAIATAGQDFVQLGRESAKLLLRQAGGEPADDITYVMPEFIPRQSCGCLGKEDTYTDSVQDNTADAGSLSEYVESSFVELFDYRAPYGQIISWTETLLGIISTEPFNKEGFLTALDKIFVSYYYTYSTDFSVWHKALIALAAGLEIHKDEFTNAHKILSTLTYATTLVYDIRMREERKKEYSLNDDRMRRRRNTNALLLMFDIETLVDELCRSISELSMNTALIGIYGNAVKRGSDISDRSVETLIGFDKNDKINIHYNDMSPVSFSDFTSIKGFDFDRERRTMFCLPLFSMEEEVGVMLLPYDPETPTDTYETLRINISTTLKGASLISTIRTLSVTDELTGLLNRRGFFQFTYSRLYHLRRSEDTVPLVMFMDMDGLKLINDNYGHSEGDRAIRIFADILKQTMREEDIIGRVGGDEFAALSSVKFKDNARGLEERLRAAYDEYNAKELHPYRISGSFGCVVLDEATKECFENAMLSADKVLYDEKMKKKKLGLSR